MEKRGTISFDLDDTLFDAVEEFIPFTNKNYSTNFSFKKIRNSDVVNEKIPPSQEIARWKQFFESKEGLSIKPKINVLDAVKRLSKDYRLIIISARDLELQNSARKWVKRHFGNVFSKIVFIKSARGKIKKSTACLRNKVILHVDDNPKHVLDCMRHKIPIIMISRPWNKSARLQVPRMSDVTYKGVQHILKKEYTLLM